MEPVQTSATLSKCSYNIIRKNDSTGVVISCGIYDTAGLAPPMSDTNRNIFNQLFGNEFPCLNEMGKAPMSAIRAISTYEYSSMFGFHVDLTVKLVELSNSHLLGSGIPALTSSAIISRFFRELFNLRQKCFEVLDDSSSTVNETVFSYFGGAIGARLPDKNAWMHVFEGDPITVALKALASIPSLL